jgi:hypothetical protein
MRESGRLVGRFRLLTAEGRASGHNGRAAESNRSLYRRFTTRTATAPVQRAPVWPCARHDGAGRVEHLTHLVIQPEPLVGVLPREAG